MYLLDTNICIYLIKKNSASVVKQVKKHKPYQIKISAITIAELEYGVSKSLKREQNRNAVMDFVSAFDIIPFDDSDAEVFGIIKADLERRGRVIGPYDMQIAAQAIVKELVLVTNNVKEFERVPGLRFENWVE